MFAMQDSTTFQQQPTIPRLPLPALDKTLNLLQDVIAPQLTADEKEELKREVLAFQTGLGPKLHAMLEKENSDPEVKSFLERFWNDSYLSARAPIVVNVNPVFLMEPDMTPQHYNNQMARTASLTYSALKFVQALRSKRLNPDSWRSTPMCMLQYTKLFGTSRIPQPKCDATFLDPTSTHIVVMCRGQFYRLDCMQPGGIEVGTTEVELKAAFEAIMEDASSVPDGNIIQTAVGVLTTLDRDKWAELRARLVTLHARNGKALGWIDSSLFVVNLDDIETPTVTETTSNLLHGSSRLVSAGEGKLSVQCGTCLNRWYDKTIQMVVTKNAQAGLNTEHSLVDGHTVLRFISDIFTDAVLAFAKRIRADVSTLLMAKPKPEVRVKCVPHKITWHLDNALRDEILIAEAKIADVICDVKLHALEFRDFGSDFIKYNHCSPDGFMQSAIQLAYFRLYGRTSNIYETVQMKHFRHGRTEAARSLSSPMIDFVHKVCDPHATVEAKVAALLASAGAHSKQCVQLASGNGCERHLFALEALEVEQGLEKSQLFKTEAWRKLNHNGISSSNCGNMAIHSFGFGAVCPDGYGVGYLINDDGFNFCISSTMRQTDRFADSLQSSLRLLQLLLEENKPRVAVVRDADETEDA